MSTLIPGPLMSTSRFGVADYAVFAFCLIFSAAIGLYFGLTGGRQKTGDEFMLGDRKMHVIPVAMSLLASFMSAIGTLGNPAEVYTYGFMYIWIIPSYVISMYLAGYLYIPVFYRLKITSIYEYLDLRFHSKILRMLGAFCYVMQMLTYMAIVLYTPSLAVSVVTGLSVWISVLSVGAVTTFYTAIGGIKAVVWTDTFQILVMFTGMFAVVIRGVVMMGSESIWRIAEESGRLDYLDWPVLFNPNPLQRHSFWTLVIGGTFYWTSTYGTNQAQVQRALSVGSLRRAQLSFWINLPGLILVALLGAIAGIIIYAHFHLCDPILSGVITARDQLYPLYVMQSLGHIPGLPGLIISAVACGSLSTLSSGLNSLATVFLKDIIMVTCKPDLDEIKAAKAAKIIAVVFGLAVIALSFIVSSLGQVLQATYALFGAFGGPIYAVFTLGLFMPFVNATGAVCGFLTSLVFTMWLGVGGQFRKPAAFKYPISEEGCYIPGSSFVNTTGNYTNTTTASPFNITTPMLSTTTEWVQQYNIYSISHMYIVPVALIVCVIVATIVSLLTGGRHQKVEKRLLSPLSEKLLCCFPEKLTRLFYCGVIVEDKQPRQVKKSNKIELEEQKNGSHESNSHGSGEIKKPMQLSVPH